MYRYSSCEIVINIFKSPGQARTRISYATVPKCQLLPLAIALSICTSSRVCEGLRFFNANYGELTQINEN